MRLLNKPKPLDQDVLQKAAQEFVRRQGHGLPLVRAAVLVPKGHRAIVGRNDGSVRQCSAKRLLASRDRDPTAPIRRKPPTWHQQVDMGMPLECACPKHATIHTLRHSYGTHLLEHGVSLRTIQQLLGHQSLRTTEIYMHVTQPGIERLQETLDRLMSDL